MLLTNAAFLAAVAAAAAASPTPAAAGHTNYVLRRTPVSRRAQAQGQADSTLQKRSTQQVIQQIAPQSAISIDVDIGTPPQTLPILVDTGSLPFFVIGSDCTVCPEKVFNTSKSSTFKKEDNRLLETGYLDGSNATGVYGMETVSFGGQTATVEVGVAGPQTLFLEGDVFSGMMGFGWGTDASASRTSQTKHADPPWQSLVGNWTDKEFGIYMVPPKDEYKDWTYNQSLVWMDNGGLLTFGGTEANLYDGDMAYYTLITDNQDTMNGWAFEVNGYNGLEAGNVGVLDTGSSQIAGPVDAIEKLYTMQNIPTSLEYLNGSGMVVYPCEYANNITFSLRIGGKDHVIPPAYLSIPINSTTCAGTLVPYPGGNTVPFWLLGDPFMMTYYTAYRYDPPSVGIAPVARNAKTWFDINVGSTAKSNSPGETSTTTDTGDSTKTSSPATSSGAGSAKSGALSAPTVAAWLSVLFGVVLVPAVGVFM